MLIHLVICLCTDRYCQQCNRTLHLTEVFSLLPKMRVKVVVKAQPSDFYCLVMLLGPPSV